MSSSSDSHVYSYLNTALPDFYAEKYLSNSVNQVYLKNNNRHSKLLEQDLVKEVCEIQKMT